MSSASSPMARAACGWCGHWRSRPTRTGSSNIATSTWTICASTRRRHCGVRPDPRLVQPSTVLALSRTLRAGSAGAAAFAAASLTAAARGALPEGLSSLANAVLVTAWRSVGQVNGCVAGVLYALLIRFWPWSAKRLMSPPEYAMPAPTSPLEAKEAPEAPDETVPKAAGRERREAERLIADWEDETRR